MSEIKVNLSLTLPGSVMLSEQECEENPQESYNEHKMLIKYTKGKGKFQKEVKKLIVVKTRKQKMVSQNINICEEAYQSMLHTPTSPKLSKPTKLDKNGDVVERVWDTMSVHERLKEHFDLMAHDLHAVSYSYEILGD